MESGKLGESPVTCQVAKSEASAGPFGTCRKEPWGCATAKVVGIFRVPMSSQSAGLRKVVGGEGCPPPVFSPEERVLSNPRPFGPPPTTSKLPKP